MKNNLKAVRTNAGLTQEQLADMIGTSKTYISQLESDTRNISQIRQDTMARLCSALNCTVDDIIVKAEMEYDEEGRLVVDELFANGASMVARIEKDYFSFPSGVSRMNGEEIAKSMKYMPNFKPLRKTNAAKYLYLLYNCVPRKGFSIPVGRAILPEEFEEIRKRFNLTDDDISSEFVDTRGGIYGKKYAKTFTAVQIKIPEFSAIPLEEELKNKGIEAGNTAPGRVNIRVK